ncbi:hypothetical protein RFN28_31535, partial [Mesorhizobium sp. VK24D]
MAGIAVERIIAKVTKQLVNCGVAIAKPIDAANKGVGVIAAMQRIGTKATNKGVAAFITVQGVVVALAIELVAIK